MISEKRGQKIYVSTVLLASSVLLYGNNFEKVSLLARNMNLKYVSSTTFSGIHSLYSLPRIRELWNKMKEIIWKVFENDVLVVCGEGRMNSPGFSAKYCVYTMMEHYLNVIVDLEVVNKREAGGTSTLMEKIGCKRLLERMMDCLDFGDLVTNASTVIMKIVREMKGMITQAIDLYFSSFPLHSYSLEMLMITAHMHDVLPPIHYPYIASWLWVDLNCPIVDLIQLAIFFFRGKLYSPSKLFSLSGYLAKIKLTAKISAVSISGFSYIIE